MPYNDNPLSDPELQEVTNTLFEEAFNNRDISNLRNIIETTEVDPDAELESEVINVPINEESIDIIAKEIEDLEESDLDIFEVDQLDEENQRRVEEASANEAKAMYDLSDEEALVMLEIISNYRDNPNYPVYDKMPAKMKQSITQMAVENGVPPTQWNAIARSVINQFLEDAAVEEAYIDFQKSLDEALDMPSIPDMYAEHTKNVMEEKIPEMIEAVKEEAPEKAELLANIKDRFTAAYTFELARTSYDENSRVRKAIRRHEISLNRCLTEFNFKNEKSKFKMNDITEIPIILRKVLIQDIATTKEHHKNELYQKIVSMDITNADIDKFCILITKSCENFDPDDISDAAYMYYMMKNIVILKLTQEAKTEFAAELISNICDTIAFIRYKEAEFNEANGKSDKKLRTNEHD